MIKKIRLFEYDTTPTEDGEIIVAFKVDGSHCEMRISERTLRDMLSWIELNTPCSNCKNTEKICFHGLN